MSISRAKRGPKPEIFDTNIINVFTCAKKEICHYKCKRFVILNSVVRRESRENALAVSNRLPKIAL